MGYYDGDIEDDGEAKTIDMENGTKDEENESKAKGDDIEVEDEEVEAIKAEDKDLDDYPYGWPSD